MKDLIAVLSALGSSIVDQKKVRDQIYLQDNGWICLGKDSADGLEKWTNLERGLQSGPNGPVTFARALSLQRTVDVIKLRKESV